MAGRLATTVSATLALALVAGAGAIVWADGQTGRVPAVAVQPGQVEVTAGKVELVCPGAPRSVTDTGAGTDLAYDPGFDPTPTDASVEVQAAELPAPNGELGTATLQPISSGDAAAELDGDKALVGPMPSGPSPIVVSLDPAGGQIAQGVAAVGAVSQTGDLRSLSAATCARPTASAFLLGGTTVLGASTRLVLLNPGATTVTASFDIWGPSGVIDGGNTSGILIPPGSERDVTIEAQATDLKRLAVKVEASGGELVAMLVDARTDGLRPLGADYVTAAAAPSKEIFVPAITVEDTTLEIADPSVLRILVPGDQAAEIKLELWGPKGPVTLPGLAAGALTAGAVTDLPLSGLPAGTYTAHITSDVPITASAMVTTVPSTADAPIDRLWVASAPLEKSGLLAGPAGVSATVAFMSPTATTVTIAPVTGTGAMLTPVTIELAAKQTLAVPLADLGADVVALSYQSTSSGGLSVGLNLSVATDQGPLISAITPITWTNVTSTQAVRQGQRLGIAADSYTSQG